MRSRTLAAATVAGAGLGLGVLAWQALTPTAALEAGPRTVEIPAREGVLEIAQRLRAAGVIRSRPAFVLLSLVRGSARRLRAGEYEVARRATTLDVLALMEHGRVKQHAILHPEGGTVSELARELERLRLADAATVVHLAHDPDFVRSLGVDAPSLEGYLFPDTYHLVRGMTGGEILARMVQRLRAKLGPAVTARADELGLTVHELLTLASIVEREAVVPDERRLIAAVFWNRLKRAMPLQADPTVQYGLGKGRQALSRSDLRVEHPFNTYRRSGLPPGPIASPGLDSIDAVLDPAPVPFLYFVAKDDRTHHFSTTIEQHNAAVARYRARPAATGRAVRPRS